jgi:prepilin-type N-terminal cleavage/methylation domain-containing protein/prepilin-type processing-associated H-X9-DG protein
MVHPAPRESCLRARVCSRAFTLIELLTVIAIIGVLSGLVIGGISRMRDSARRSSCSSNLRQIGSAFQLYAAENRGLYPAPRLPDTSKWDASLNYSKTNLPPEANPSGENWQVEISRYIFREQTNINQVKNTYAESNIAHCPSYDLFFNTSASLASQSIYSTAGYGMNMNLNVGGANYNSGTWGKDNASRFRAVALNHISQTVLVGDSSEYFINVGTSWSLDASHPDGYANGAPKRHGASANYLFADGHVASLSPDQALIASRYRP